MTTIVERGNSADCHLSAFVASVAKAVEIRQLSNGPDFTYNFAILQFCVVGENNVVMIAASIPMLRALYTKDKTKTRYAGGASQRPSTPRNMSVFQKHIKGSQRSTSASHKATITATTRSASDDEEMMLSNLDKDGGVMVHKTIGTAYSAAGAPEHESDGNGRTSQHGW